MVSNLCEPLVCSMLGSTLFHYLPEFGQTHVHWIQWCHPTISSSVTPFSSCPQSFPASVFSNESDLYIRRPKHWSFSLSISPSNEYSGLTSCRIDWFDPAAQGTLKSLLWHHNWKASILQFSAFYMAQPSHPHMTTGKTIALTIWTFVLKVTSLLFNNAV